jgi:hypothetical protein
MLAQTSKIVDDELRRAMVVALGKRLGITVFEREVRNFIFLRGIKAKFGPLVASMLVWNFESPFDLTISTVHQLSWDFVTGLTFVWAVYTFPLYDGGLDFRLKIISIFIKIGGKRLTLAVCAHVKPLNVAPKSTAQMILRVFVSSTASGRVLSVMLAVGGPGTNQE